MVIWGCVFRLSWVNPVAIKTWLLEHRIHYDKQVETVGYDRGGWGVV